MIDDMDGLYSHASEAYRAGKVAGRDELFRASIGALGAVSAKHEKGSSSGLEGQLVTERFHVAEECCATVRKIRDALDARRETV